MKPFARGRAAVALLAVLALGACPRPSATTTGVQPLPTAAWTRDAVVYEVNVRQFTPQGTLRALAPHLPRLDSLGVDVLWLMPVQPIGVKNRKGPLGSYYSIADYRTVNPEFGTAADFRALVAEAHRQGMKVILDWVANHTAFDHPWITAHPDWYVHRPDGSISYPLDQSGKETDWTDVAELNFDSPAMRQAMIADMRYWVDSMDIDGFRADVAWGVPMDFWREARRRLTAGHPDLFFLAESEGPQYHAAFDATYGWELHHLMNQVAQGKEPASRLDEYFAKQKREYPLAAYRMYFTSNHDENSWSGTEFERMGENNTPAYVLSATARSSIPLLYTGQEASLGKRLRFFEKDTVDWNGPSRAAFYRGVFALREANRALWSGADGGEQVTLAHDGGDRVYAFTRARGDNTVLVAVNFGDAPKVVGYRGLAAPGEFTDWFSKAKQTLTANGTLEVPAHGFRVLVR